MQFYPMDNIDAVQINFDQDNILLLNISLGLIMYGVALNLTVHDFKRVFRKPKPALLGLCSQFILLPLLTFLLVIILRPGASIGLGMIMVAACPGGNISNFMSHLSKANTALSVSLTAVSTVLAIFMTPLNLAFWASFYGPTEQLLREVSLDIFQVFKTVTIILGIPLVLGMLTRAYQPRLAMRLKSLMQVLSILIFAAIVILAFLANFELFLQYIHVVMFIVLVHNGVAVISGFQLGVLFKLPLEDRKTLAIETGIQNSGLGLLLIFAFFDGLGGMAIVAAWWGIWHIISGLSLASWWNYKLSWVRS